MDVLSRTIDAEMRLRCAAAVCVFICGGVAYADDTLQGHIKTQFNAVRLSDDDSRVADRGSSFITEDLDVRLNGRPELDPLTLDVQVEYLASGNAPEERFALIRELRSVSGLSDDRSNVADLALEADADGTADTVLHIDRLSAQMKGESVFARIGRQALSWGNGLAFNPLDFANPFTPIEIDKEYKPGADLVFTQWAPDASQDVQAVIIGRRNLDTRKLTADASTAAMKWRRSFADGWLSDSSTTADVVGGVSSDDFLFGGSVTGEVLGGIWRSDALLTRENNGTTRLSFVVNADRTFVALEHNLYGFIEYFRNGFGEGTLADTIQNDGLVARLRRGELFTRDRDYIASGGRLELSELTNLLATFVVNLRDGSGVSSIRIERSLSDQLLLTLGTTAPWGSLGDEFGGDVFSAGPSDPATTVRGAHEVYTRFSLHF